MESHQKAFLLKDWGGRVAHLGEDRDDRGILAPEARRLVEGGERIIEWLQSGLTPDPELRVFLEEQLSAFDLDTGYEQLAYERGVLAAAIEDLR